MSMSNGELHVVGSRATYEISMPLYEITHLKEPESTLLESIRLTSQSREPRRLNESCVVDSASEWYQCHSVFEFTAPIEQLEVECSFAAVTVPNHVHLLRATKGDVTKQVVFDFNFTSTTVRFTPPTNVEVALADLVTGAGRVAGGPAQLLFLIALVLAARNRRELFYMSSAFVTVEVVSASTVAAKSWQLTPQFIEATGALTIAYLAVEIVFLPDARHRWLIAAGMGIFHGFYFGTFMQQLEISPTYLLTGVVATEGIILMVFGWSLTRFSELVNSRRVVQVGGFLLGLVGVVWFILSMWV